MLLCFQRIFQTFKSNLRSFGLLGHPELQLIFPFLAVSFFSLLRVILQTTFLWYFAFNERIMLIDCVFNVELGGREKNFDCFQFEGGRQVNCRSLKQHFLLQKLISRPALGSILQTISHPSNVSVDFPTSAGIFYLKGIEKTAQIRPCLNVFRVTVSHVT